jgi:hypothetical protein
MTADKSVQYLGSSGNSYNYESDPVAAMASYAKLMHLHTKKQMDAAQRASRRRSSESATDVQATPTKEGSTHSTTSGTSSRMPY